MIECSKETPWGYHPELRGDDCPRCGFQARPRSDFPLLRHRRAPQPSGWTLGDASAWARWPRVPAL
jgi:hypothetical protein